MLLHSDNFLEQKAQEVVLRVAGTGKREHRWCKRIPAFEVTQTVSTVCDPMNGTHYLCHQCVKRPDFFATGFSLSFHLRKSEKGKVSHCSFCISFITKFEHPFKCVSATCISSFMACDFSVFEFFFC